MATTGRVTVESLSLPFTGAIPVSRHCSHQGAVAASERVWQCLALLAAYAKHGPLTDAETAKALDVERSTINARRATLIKVNLVRAYGTKKNVDTGVTNVMWGLTTKGADMADEPKDEPTTEPTTDTPSTPDSTGDSTPTDTPSDPPNEAAATE